MKLTTKIMGFPYFYQLQKLPKLKVPSVLSESMVIPVFLVFISCTPMKVQAQASYVGLGTGYQGGKSIDDVLEQGSYVSDAASEFALSGKFSHAVAFQPAGKGLSAISRSGYLHASVGSSIFYSGDSSQPQIYYFCGGNAGGSFVDTLTITDGGFGSLPEDVLVRVGWRASGSMAYLNHNPEADVHGSTSYEWSCAGLNTSSSKQGALGPREGATYGGQPSQTLILEEVLDTNQTSGSILLPLSATVQVSSQISASYGIPTAYFGEADTSVTLELLFIEVVDPATNNHLAVTVTSASGHKYPVVQPSVPGVAFGVTSMLIDRDLGRGFISFSSASSGNFRVKGGADLANFQSWQELAVVSGISGINVANWNDSEAITQPIRFYVVEKLDE